MTINQLIAELNTLSANGHGNDDIGIVLKDKTGYVYQNLFTVTHYKDEKLIGLIGNGLIDDRRL